PCTTATATILPSTVSLHDALPIYRVVGSHRFDVTALYGIQSDRTTTDTVEARNLPYDSQLWYNLGTGENPQPPRSSLSVWKLASDRKSTRLNSSHEWISYAVFCLK